MQLNSVLLFMKELEFGEIVSQSHPIRQRKLNRAY
jgi:hypothetical protein